MLKHYLYPTKVVDASTDSALAQSVAKFIQVQTDMLAAQTKAMAAQSLPPPLKHFSGEGSLVGDESHGKIDLLTTGHTPYPQCWGKLF